MTEDAPYWNDGSFAWQEAQAQHRRDTDRILNEQIEFSNPLPFGQHHAQVREWERKEAARRHESYTKQLKKTGQVTPIDEWLKGDKKRSQTAAMSRDMADKMQRLGMKGYTEGGQCSGIFAPLSGLFSIFPNWRKNNAIPAVSQTKRAPYLKELEHFCNNLPIMERGQRPSVRMLTIKDGQKRCHSLFVCDRWKAQNKRINNFNRSLTAQLLGAQIVFRRNELGSPYKKAHEKVFNEKSGKWERPYLKDAKGKRIRQLDENGLQTWHPHTHCVLYLSRWLQNRKEWLNTLDERHYKAFKDNPEIDDSEWNRLCRFIKSHFFGQSWTDAGHICDPREVCKYMVKSEELLHLRDIDFMRILRRTFRKKTVQPKGILADQIRKHKEACDRVVYEMTPDGPITQVESNWNRSVISKGKVDRERTSDKPVITSKLRPMPLLSPICEPLFTFRGHFDAETLLKDKQVKRVSRLCKVAFAAGMALFTAQHDMTVTEFLDQAPMLQASLQAASETKNGSLSVPAHNTPASYRPPLLALTSPKTFPMARGHADPDPWLKNQT